MTEQPVDAPEIDDSRTDAEQLAAEDITHVTLKFRPERWVTRGRDEYAVQAGDYIDFTVPVSDVLDENGEFFTERSYEMDWLQTHDNAPDTVQNWTGPFELYYHELHSGHPEKEPDRTGGEGNGE